MDLLTPLIWLLMAVDTMGLAERRDKLRDRERERTRKPIRTSTHKERRINMDGKKDSPDNTEGLVRFEGHSVEDTVQKLLNRKNYAKSDPPRFDKPTKVALGIYVNSFYSISEQTMDYMVSMYLRQQWQDRRLEFEAADDKSKIRLGEGSWEKLWVPDTFFRNEKGANFHTVTVKNRLMTLNSSGFLWYVTKISATLSCPMKLQKYPLDTQHCPMMFESFGYTMDTMYFAWLPSPVDIDPNVQLPQFTLKDKILYDCSQNYTAGAFPCLEIQFVLSRDIGFFLIQVYIPTILIVILSWVSFWINVEATPARVSLGLLTVLTMTTQSAGMNSSLPRVSYIKAIDVWFSMCLVFVFASLLEFAVVNVVGRKQSKAISKRQLPPPPLRMDQIDQVNIVENGRDRRGPPIPNKVPSKGMSNARNIDRVSRKMFPMAFLLFNIVYWIIYTLPGATPTSLG